MLLATTLFPSAVAWVWSRCIMPSMPKTPLSREGSMGLLCIFWRRKRVGVVELLDIVGAVVRGQGDADEDDHGAAGPESGDDLVEICAGVFDAQAAETVVAAELNDDDRRLHGDDVVDALDAVFGGVAADALIDDAIVIAPGVEVGLEIVGITFAEFGAVACGEAVAETDDDGTLVVDDGGRDWRGGEGSFGCGRCCLCCCWFC